MLIIIAAVIVVFVGVKILKSVSEATDTYDRVPMVMAVDGKLCLDTGYKSALANRPDSVVYTINSAVDGSETPVESNQSNFGIGYRYQFVSDETIEVEIDGSWWVYVTESKRRESVFGNLSDRTILLLCHPPKAILQQQFKVPSKSWLKKLIQDLFVLMKSLSTKMKLIV